MEQAKTQSCFPDKEKKEELGNRGYEDITCGIYMFYTKVILLVLVVDESIKIL